MIAVRLGLASEFEAVMNALIGQLTAAIFRFLVQCFERSLKPPYADSDSNG